MNASPFFAPLQSLLNRQLARSSPAAQAARELDGRVLAIRIRNTGLTMYLQVQDQQLSLHPEWAQPPDAFLETTPLGLAELAQGRLSAGRVTIGGDPVVATQFEQLLRHTHPDWEEELSGIVGDVAAHHIGTTVRGVLALGQQAARSLGLDTAEFLSEESRDIAATTEIDMFNRQVKSLDEAVEALRRRIDTLQNQVP